MAVVAVGAAVVGGVVGAVTSGAVCYNVDRAEYADDAPHDHQPRQEPYVIDENCVVCAPESYTTVHEPLGCEALPFTMPVKFRLVRLLVLIGLFVPGFWRRFWLLRLRDAQGHRQQDQGRHCCCNKIDSY
jgi:hypothetical protein